MAEAKYKLLEKGDRIQIGDEGLDDDCETWRPVEDWRLCVGHRYNPWFHVPVRRKLQSQ